MLRAFVRRKRNLYFLKRVLGSPRVLVNTIRIMLAYRRRSLTVRAQPVVIDIEPTNACNFRCPHCPVTHADWKRYTLRPEVLTRLLGLFPHALRVKLQGMGEPFLHKSLPDFIDEACRTGAWVEITSNASLFDARPVERLARHANLEVTVSLDGATKGTFERMRPGSDFDAIVKNIRSSPLDLSAWMVVTQDNQHEVMDVIRLAADAGVKQLGLQFVVLDYGKQSLDPVTVEKRVGQPPDRDTLYREAKTRNIRLHVSDQLYDKKHICPWPWQGVYIDTQENVVPCCRIGDAAVMNMGSLREKSFEEIWNSPEYQQFRAAHRDGRVPDVCRSCYRHPGATRS